MPQLPKLARPHHSGRRRTSAPSTSEKLQGLECTAKKKVWREKNRSVKRRVQAGDAEHSDEDDRRRRNLGIGVQILTPVTSDVRSRLRASIVHGLKRREAHAQRAG